MKNIFLLFLLMAFVSCQREGKDEALLEGLMKTGPVSLQYVLAHRDMLEVQVLYTQIDRDGGNRPHFTTYSFNVDPKRYFYPASTVKFPLVLMALEKINALGIAGFDKYTPMFHDSLYAGQQSVRRDTTAENGLPSVAHYVKKILVASDNDAFNRLYEFMGQGAITDKLKEGGYGHTRIVHRLSRPLSLDGNAHTEGVRFVHGDAIVYEQGLGVNTRGLGDLPRVLKGKGYMKDDTVLVREPFDFTYKNFFPLGEQQKMLRDLVFPKAAGPGEAFQLTDEDRRFVLQYMSQLPTETHWPPYFQDTAYHQASLKYLMGGGKGDMPHGIRIFNKVGQAYGYLIDNAYIIDESQGIEFFLSAVILCNSDGVFNDNRYEYDSIGFPFLRDLGQAVYTYERGRKRARKPDLSEFKLAYEK